MDLLVELVVRIHMQYGLFIFVSYAYLAEMCEAVVPLKKIKLHLDPES